jgi:hypothetical protein
MDISKLIPKPITVALAGSPVFTLRPFTTKDLDFIEFLLDAPEGEPGEFTRTVLQHFAEGNTASELIGHLETSDLRETAAIWAAAPFNFETELSALESTAFLEFHEAARSRVASERWRQAKLKRLADSTLNPTTLRILNEVRRYDAMTRELLRVPTAHLEALTRLQEVSLPPDLLRTAMGAGQHLFEVSRVAQKAAEQLAGITGSAAHLRVPQLEAQRLFSSLPDLSRLVPRWESWIRDFSLGLEEAEKAAQEGGVGFASEIVADLDWRGTEHISERVRKAVITTRLTAMTRSNEFVSGFLSTLRGNPLLKRRATIVAAALTSHGTRGYVVSVPALLAQIEGVFTDLLIFKGEAVRMKGKAVPLTKTGQPRTKPKKDGTPQIHPYVGMQDKIQNSLLRRDTATKDVVTFMLDNLVPERNAILHGESVTYGRAKMSTQLVLTLAVLSDVLYRAYEGELLFDEDEQAGKS